MKEWFTARELAGLPSIPGTPFGLRKKALAEGWRSQTRQSRGGGREYHISSLPATAHEALVERLLEAPIEQRGVALAVAGADRLPAIKPQSQASVGTPYPLAFGGWQCECELARRALLAVVDRLSLSVGRAAAVRDLAARATRGELPEALQRLVSIANARAGKEGKRTLSRPTLNRWFALRERNELAPREPAKRPTPLWGAPLLGLYRRPTKPGLKTILERELAPLLPEGVALPSLHQASYFLNGLPEVARMKGRLGPKELKALRPYIKRTTADLLPLDVVTGDGHTADFKVAHPIHGKAFRPEITAILDVKTRKAIGWSAALKENGFAVLDALRCACISHGIPAIFYTDNGSGYCNDLLTNLGWGILTLLGVEHRTSIPYNSQARGVIERSHQSIWISAARALPSYVGRDMDREALKKIEKKIAGDIKERGTSELLMTWPGFLAWGQKVVDDYNARAHRGLPKIDDPVTGKRRHMSPNDAWQAARDAGFVPMSVGDDEAGGLFMPMERRTVSRGLVRLMGKEYFSRELEDWHGREVGVGYDIFDPSYVRITSSKGKLICLAGLDAHARPYFPKAAIDLARERRARARMKTVERHREEIEAELGPVLIESAAEVPLTPEEIEAADAELARLAPSEAPKEDTWNGRPIFQTDEEYVAWMRAHPDEINDDDRAWLKDGAGHWEFRMLHHVDREGNLEDDVPGG